MSRARADQKTPVWVVVRLEWEPHDDCVEREDEAVVESVQRGLRCRAYDVGRLSVRREAGEHLFHRLLHADLMYACSRRV